MKARKHAFSYALVPLLFLNAAASAAEPQRTVRIQGRIVRYQETVETFSVSDTSGQHHADLRTVSYVVGDHAPATRPVIFAFNGGPGSASLWLNFGALGPNRIAIAEPGHPAASGMAVANDRSPLNLADIVMIDPVDTGFSRAAPGDSPKVFFDTREDGHATAELIRAWLGAHGRAGAPVFLIGESFGCQRAVMTAHELSGPSNPVRIGGIVLISQALNMNEVAERRLTRNVVAAALALPTIAKLAWYHRLIDRHGHDEAQFLQAAESFAGGEYLAALFQGRSIADERKRAIATKLEAFTGIPAAYYLAHELMISRDTFRSEALRGQGRILATFDARYSAPVEDGKVGQDPFLDQAMGHFRDAATAALERIPHPDGLPYRVDSPEALKAWTFGNSATGERPFVRYLEEMLAAQPQARLLIFGGRYDLASTEPTTRYMIAQSALPLDRTRVVYVDSGHMVYTDAAGAAVFARDIREMLNAAPAVAHQPE